MAHVLQFSDVSHQYGAVEVLITHANTIFDNPALDPALDPTASPMRTSQDSLDAATDDEKSPAIVPSPDLVHLGLPNVSSGPGSPLAHDPSLEVLRTPLPADTRPLSTLSEITLAASSPQRMGLGLGPGSQTSLGSGLQTSMGLPSIGQGLELLDHLSEEDENDSDITSENPVRMCSYPN